MAKRRRRGVESTILNSELPVFAIDARRRIVSFNRGCERLTGWTAEEVLGVICEYAGDAELTKEATVGGGLCPPPDVFRGKVAHLPAHILTRTGTTIPRCIHYLPLTDEPGDVPMVVGFITEPEITPPAQVASVSQRLHAELAALRAAVRERYGFASVIGRSEAMQRVQAQIAVARDCQASVLFIGEKGTGKEHLARVVHTESGQSARAFVPLHCSQLPARELRRTLKRMLQPTEDDAVANSANSPGTLFLQDVEALPADCQEMLVQHLQQPADGAPDVRLISSTKTPLNDDFERRGLRDDFYFAATSLQIELPRLANRPEDLEPLAQACLEEHNRGDDRQVVAFSNEAWEQFRAYRWPGNLDELRTVIAEARQACETNDIEVSDLPFRFRTGLDAQKVGAPVRPLVEPLESYLHRMELELIRNALEQSKHNKTAAAKLLGMTRPRLYRRMESLGIADDADESTERHSSNRDTTPTEDHDTTAP